VEGVASLSQSRTAAAQYGLFTHKSVPVIFEPPCRQIWRRRPHLYGRFHRQKRQRDENRREHQCLRFVQIRHMKHLTY